MIRFPFDLASEPARPIRSQMLFAVGNEPGLIPHIPIEWLPPTSVEWSTFELPLAHWPAALNNFRILHLTDTHLKYHWPAVLDAMLKKIADNPPDLLLFTGDFVDNKRNSRPAMPLVRRLVAGFKARFGCFAIHGNHDNYTIGRQLGDSPITFLDGKRQLLNLPGGQIELIGLPGRNRLELRHRFIAAIPPANPKIPRIVLSHYPDHLRRTGGLGADLFLAGHTHGGQICLPSGTPLLWHDSLPRHLATGVNRIGQTWLVVGRGLGYTGIPLRSFCPAQVVEIRCKSGEVA